MSEESRRQSKRYRVSWSCRLLFQDKRIEPGRVKDVSSGGVGFEYIDQIAEGTEVSIEFTPMVRGKKYQVRAKGEVMFNMMMKGSSGFTHGLKFTLVPREQFAQLTEVLKLLE